MGEHLFEGDGADIAVAHQLFDDLVDTLVRVAFLKSLDEESILIEPTTIDPDELTCFMGNLRQSL